ncbi:MAG: hypothetical protein LJE94_11535 [Deltaproteobacteria bacterium]|nr:hypothetical protein [Deltaproteobacteria bacterium]
MVKIILSTLIGFAVIALLIALYEIIVEKYPRRSVSHLNPQRVQHPSLHYLATDALKAFFGMPEIERDAVTDNLSENLISVDQWLVHLQRADYQILCIGELHEESTRRFLADAFFSNFSLDTLLIEASPEALRHLNKTVAAGHAYFPLLGADMTSILKKARAKNPKIEIHAIEDVDTKENNSSGQAVPRDQTMAQNFWRRYRPGLRHAVLIGSLHCMYQSGWFFGFIRDQSPEHFNPSLLNACILEEHQNGLLEAFVFFLDGIGLNMENIVVLDTTALHPLIYQWFSLLDQQILSQYQSVVVFRSGYEHRLPLEAKRGPE